MGRLGDDEQLDSNPLRLSSSSGCATFAMRTEQHMSTQLLPGTSRPHHAGDAQRSALLSGGPNREKVVLGTVGHLARCHTGTICRLWPHGKAKEFAARDLPVPTNRNNHKVLAQPSSSRHGHGPILDGCDHRNARVEQWNPQHPLGLYSETIKYRLGRNFTHL